MLGVQLAQQSHRRFAYSPEETDALAEVLADTDVVTFSDEMYDRLLFGGRTFKSFAATSEHAYDHTITFNAGSKTYSMTGWRIGYAAGPVDVIKGMAKLQSQTTSGAATFTMHALAAALDGDQSCVEVMRAEFERRGQFLSDRLNALDGVVCPEPGGAFYAFPDVSGTFRGQGRVRLDRVGRPPAGRRPRGRGAGQRLRRRFLRAPQLRHQHGGPGNRAGSDRGLPRIATVALPERESAESAKRLPHLAGLCVPTCHSEPEARNLRGGANALRP